MNIILSGGWGYGNLGDDAILISSITLLKRKYQDCHIIVLSYNVQETHSIIDNFDNILVLDSLHTKLYGMKTKKFSCGKNLFEELKLLCYNKYKTKKERIFNNIHTKAFVKHHDCFYAKHREAIEYFENICNKADMYIMSGGGYITTWSEMHISKFCEIDIAKRHNLKTYIIGQTIGPFRGHSWKIASMILSKSDGCFFRDELSILDAQKLGHKCLEYIVPDLVLCNSFFKPKDNYIVFIPFSVNLLSNMKVIIDNLAKINKESNVRIIITVSQQWPGGTKIGLHMYFLLKEKGIDVQMIIPHDYKELIDIVASAQMTFSQNLHGLILSFCSHTPIVSLNKKRKFVSFMNLINQPNNIYSAQEITNDSLYNCYKKRNEFDFNYLTSFEKQIHEALDKILI